MTPLASTAAPATSAPDPHLRDWLAGRDVQCPVCGYNIRDLTTTTCPECAAHLHLQVGSENLHPGPWFVAVLGPALALGFDAVVTVLLTAGLILSPPKSPYEQLKVGVMFGLFVMLAAAGALTVWLLFRRRRAWIRLPRRRQWRMALTMFGAVGVIHLLFGGFLLWWMNR